MKLKDQAISKLAKILATDVSDIIGSSIVRAENHYVLYGNWQVWPQAHGVDVKKNNDVVAHFYNLKNAVCWCTAYRYGQQKLALELEHWDRELSRISNDVGTARELIKCFRDPELKLVARIKMEHNSAKLRGIQHQLEKCVKRAKYCQLQGFNDEIARTRRSTPIRTNR
jgi:hypothetical protein